MKKKFCTNCGQVKTLDNFYLQSNGYYRSECKECLSKKAKEPRIRASQAKFRKSEKRKKILERYSFKVKKLAKISHIDEKRCISCRTVKSVKEFNKNCNIKDGYSQYCKDCRYFRRSAYEARSKASQQQKRYRATTKGKISKIKSDRKNIVNIQARSEVKKAIIRGDLAPLILRKCTICGENAKEYHHHKGYEKKYWLDVIPLCSKCHGLEHRKA